MIRTGRLRGDIFNLSIDLLRRAINSDVGTAIEANSTRNWVEFEFKSKSERLARTKPEPD